MVAVPRGCAVAGAQLQEETETVSALASLTVDVEQPFASEDSRYGSKMGESLRSVTSRIIVSICEPLSRLSFTCLLHFTTCVLQSRRCRSAHYRPPRIPFFMGNRAGACGCSSHRNKGSEIHGEKNHFLLNNLMQIIMDSAACGLYFLITCSFPDIHFLSLI